MKLSIIVPVYNVERFLPRCLDSLMRQDMQTGEYEVICINDGSQDRSGIILAEYEAKHPDIFKVITQKNQGVSVARNVGMKAAQGEYITFVDSDDYVARGGYTYICQHFLYGDPDVVSYNARRVKNSEIDKLENAAINGSVTYKGDAGEAYKRLQYRTIWSKFYKRRFLLEHNIRFEDILSQDQMFNFDVFRNHPYVILTDCNIYRYMQDNEESIQTTKVVAKVRKLMDDQLYGMDVLKKYLNQGETSMSAGVKKSICDYLGIFYTKSFYANLSFKEWKRYMHPIRELGLNQILREKEKTFVGKLITMLKCVSSHSYLMYRLVGFFHRNIFEKFLLKKL